MVRILFVVNEFSFFESHRFPVAEACLKRGWEVHIATQQKDQAAQKARSRGLIWHGLALDIGSYNPFKDLLFIRDLISLYRSLKPDIVHHVTIKPVLYGSLVARWSKINSLVNALSGLGYTYINDSLKNRVIRKALDFVFKIGFRHTNHTLILQNEDDKKLILRHNLAWEQDIEIIRGSGVDEKLFSYTPESGGPIKIALPARMLWDKGVGEFIKAADIFKKNDIEAFFYLFGNPDAKNPQSITSSTLNRWGEKDNVAYSGFQDDMPSVLKAMHIICLPSYREGLPKSLLEAASVGRPIVATDVPGCREIVLDGYNGYLVPVKDEKLLAEKLKILVDQAELRQAFGKNGRRLVMDNFCVDKIVNETIKIYEKSLSN